MIEAMRSIIACGFALILLTGCASAPRGASKPRALNSNTDPCAVRLHEMCGPLLLYFAQNHMLPEDPSILADDFTCPVSHQRYVYNRDGFPAPRDSSLRVIIYDAKPFHEGARWGIAVMQPRGDAPLVAKVIAIPETDLLRTPG